MEQRGLCVQCALVPHNFGQPVENLDQAVTFLLNQRKVDESFRSKISDLAEYYIAHEDGRRIIPIRRYNCVLIFEK